MAEGQTDSRSAAAVMLLEDLRGTTTARVVFWMSRLPRLATSSLRRGPRQAQGGRTAGRGHPRSRAPGRRGRAGGRVLIRPSDTDMFRLGTDEAYAQGFEAGQRG